MIDWDRVAELKEEVGIDDFDEVIELFLEEVDEVVERLEGGSATAQLEEDLHFIKGSALNLGFDMLGQLCQQGERAAAQGAGKTVDLSQIVAIYKASVQEFTKQAAA